MLAWLNPEEAGRGDADNGEQHVLESDRLANNCRISAKAPLPEVVTNDRYRLRMFRLIVHRRERSTKQGWHAEHREKVACNFLGTNELRLRPTGAEAAFGNGAKSGET